MTRWRSAVALGALLLLLLATAAGTLRAQSAAPPADVLARGAYLARIGGCASCHTRQKDAIPFAGGRSVPSPIGDIVSTNITPDPAHGIGRYDFDDFRRVMREGTAPGTRHLYPAMPYTAYAGMTDADLRALFAYLRHGVAPSDNVPPPTDLPFPFDQRWGLRLWKIAFLPRGVQTPDPAHDAEWMRGAYLVRSVGHCSACHTPRGVALQERGTDASDPLFLSGMVNDRWFASNLRGDPGPGLGRVGESTIGRLLKTGQADGLVTLGPMKEEVEQALQYLTDDDARAIARYLKSLPAASGNGGRASSSPTVQGPARGDHTGDVESHGAAVYRSFCARCHGGDGRGVPETFPRLAGNPSVLAEDASSLIRLVLEGGRSPATPHGPAPQSMPAYAGTLSSLQVAQVLTHLRQAWGNDARPVTTADVAKLRQSLHK